jgi:hypothetical protein
MPPYKREVYHRPFSVSIFTIVIPIYQPPNKKTRGDIFISIIHYSLI